MDQQTAVYLSKAAACLPASEGISQLKSHLLWVSSTVSGDNAVNKSTMCPKCCQVWNDGKFSLKLKSSGSPGPRMVKILRKFAETPAKLNRVEKSLMERFKKNVRNKMVLHCQACMNETVLQTTKHAHPQLDKYIIKTPVQSGAATLPKKKKKRDRFAGLNVSAVLSVTPSPGAKSLIKVTDLTSETSATRSTDRQQHTSGTPSLPKSIQSDPIGQFNVKKGHLAGKKKMNFLREEVKAANQERWMEEKKALSKKNSNMKRNSKLQNYLRTAPKEIHLEDRINSLLQK
ncbi:uncharacterized protein LOC117639511 [Thrips palmi]|uniref:Uncharacterized protein LOC117639511 n=1 Tax=Thrips palmi TaxID=161013 RepID=A0A6P8Y529_THRPL|nr:uncharacterized protein LOC117639511 [Thrips palmi]